MSIFSLNYRIGGAGNRDQYADYETSSAYLRTRAELNRLQSSPEHINNLAEEEGDPIRGFNGSKDMGNIRALGAQLLRLESFP